MKILIGNKGKIRMNDFKRLCEEFVDVCFKDYKKETYYNDGTLVYIKIYPKNDSKPVVIWNDKYSLDDTTNKIVIDMKLLEDNLLYPNVINNTKKMIEHLLNEDEAHAHLYIDYEDNQVIYDYVDLYNEIDAHTSLIEMLEDYDIRVSNIDIDFILEAIRNYGSLTLGDEITIGVTYLTKREYEGSEEV